MGGITVAIRSQRLLMIMLLTGGLALVPASQAVGEGIPQCFGRDPTIVGTGDRDRIEGTAGSDVIVGGAGGDRIYGYGGRDYICGNGGYDLINGGAHDDHIDGGRNNDFMLGEGGDDTFYGGRGHGDSDAVEAGPGADYADLMDGIEGNDGLDCGPDDDRDTWRIDFADQLTNCP